MFGALTHDASSYAVVLKKTRLTKLYLSRN